MSLRLVFRFHTEKKSPVGHYTWQLKATPKYPNFSVPLFLSVCFFKNFWVLKIVGVKLNRTVALKKFKDGRIQRSAVEVDS